MLTAETIERYLSQQRLISGDLLYADSDPNLDGDVSVQQDAVFSKNNSAEVETTLSTVLQKQQPDVLQSSEAITEQESSPIELDMGRSPAWKSVTTLEELNSRICNCQKCELGATRNKFVFGVGNRNADIVVIGEAPGADEDALGEPFVGRAGQLLTKILESVEFSREEVFICNILKCRPPGNRTPLASEVDQCEPYLYKQLELLKPSFILALGLTAINTLMKSKFRMADVRGKFLNYQNVRTLVTYHPAALLRNPEWKKSTWEDVKLLRRSYDAFKVNGHLPDFDTTTVV